MARPTEYPDWATTDVVDGTSGQNNVVAPSSAKQLVGWNRREKPPRQWFNWMGRLTGQWIRQIVTELDEVNNSGWTVPVEIGTALGSFTGSSINTIAWVGSNRLAAFEAAADELRVYKFGGSFVSDATPLVLTGESATICRLAEGVLAYVDAASNELRAYDVSGSTITLLGSAFSLADIPVAALCQIGEYRIAVCDSSTKTLRAYEYNTGTGLWALVGNALAVTEVQIQPAMTGLSENKIAFFDPFLTGSAPDGTNELRIYEFDGTDWTQTGTPLVIAGEGARSISAMNETDILYIEGDTDQISVYRASDVGVWSLASIPFDVGAINAQSLSCNNGSEFALYNSTAQTIQYYRMEREAPQGPYAP